ncbi:response regulator [Herbaspirillum sp. meg3]|jgi:response regulator RpfG family c-di-GMP phosphodiesterase|uniref:response regulator n=1 Tax=Herbaspirillum sp. meg3 TaxID=2025949 RepID=UPI000B98D9AE|nr:response regulator [Herbaspirillum sp. meg3]ASU37476.1 response regulator [Herbaspirillum sp. meg3]
MSEETISETFRRRLLLVDDEVNILSALKRLLRQDKYEITTANNGQEALNMLENNPVDVIVTDQRMPGMTGVEFLRLAKESYPDTVRIVLSGYTELQSVTDAVNEGAVYKFLTKPWDDIQLRGHVAEAFRRKEMADENLRLQSQLQIANLALARTNQELDKLLREQEERIEHDEVSLQITHEILEHVSTPILGIDDERTIVFINAAAQELLGRSNAFLGMKMGSDTPQLEQALNHSCTEISLHNERYKVLTHPMGKNSRSRGKLMTLVKLDQS